MPHKDTYTLEDVQYLADVFRRPRKPPDIKFKLKQEADKKEVKRQIEAEKLRLAKQVNFEFAEPGEDWGSL